MDDTCLTDVSYCLSNTMTATNYWMHAYADSLQCL